MARWFVTQPIELCHESELVAYRALSGLDDSWTIRWGYGYLDDETPREGDFLVLGPDGRLLVLEVKKRDRVFARTGRADGRSSRIPDDVNQVQAQKAGVIRALNEAKRDAQKRGQQRLRVPLVLPAIFSTIGNSVDVRSANFPISMIRGKAELENLPAHWEALTADRKQRYASTPEEVQQIRDLFAITYGDASPEAEAKFLAATDRLILDRLSADTSVLDSLSENRQLLISGGAGSGKSWLAEHFARRLAKEGKHVLFLCYNKALAAGFRRDFLRGPGKVAGSVTVHTWESLGEHLAETLRLRLQPPSGSKETRDAYYEETVPNAMLEAVTSAAFHSTFDALVVDEGQDHNTAPASWWEIYLAQLKEGGASPVGIFFDSHQRPSFRKGAFDARTVASLLSQPAFFHLRDTRRYTRPVFDFLKSLESNETRYLVGGLHAGHLSAGPEPIVEEQKSLDAAKTRAAKIVAKWFKDGLVHPTDTLILTRADPFTGKTPAFRNCETFAGFSAVPADAPHALEKGNLRVASFNKAKGLDARAVVLLDTWPWENLPAGQRAGFWIAVSRARQLLAIVATSAPKKES